MGDLNLTQLSDRHKAFVPFDHLDEELPLRKLVLIWGLMDLTVDDLVTMKTLRTRFLAGRSGGRNRVSWAHSTELEEPWTWLGKGDLLLSNGLSIPRDATSQVLFIRQLWSAGLSGLVLGDGPESSIIGDAGLQEADRIGFPVLATDYSVPWILMVKAVADNHGRSHLARSAKMLRLYESLLRPAAGADYDASLLPRLAAECGWALEVLIGKAGLSSLPADSFLSADNRVLVVQKAMAKGPHHPAFTRLDLGEHACVILPLPISGQSFLVATSVGTGQFDPVELQHMASIINIELEHIDRTSTEGGTVLNAITSNSAPHNDASRLEKYRLDQGPWRIIEFSGVDFSPSELRVFFAGTNIPHLLYCHRENVTLLIRAIDHESVARFVNLLSPVRAGVSLTHHRLNDLPAALQEATWAAQTAGSQQGTIPVYGENSSPFMPRSISEGEAVVDQVLGSLIEYDRVNNASMLETLASYFGNNRSMAACAEALHIHRQTLKYRIGRIQEITGRDMSDISQQTELYLAVQTWKLLRLPSADSHKW
jgi:purine catabolism regulator